MVKRKQKKTKENFQKNKRKNQKSKAYKKNHQKNNGRKRVELKEIFFLKNNGLPKEFLLSYLQTFEAEKNQYFW